MPSATPVRAMMRSLRMAFKDAHPFERNPATLVAHKHDNMRIVRAAGRTAATYFPFYAFVLGWPWLVSGALKRTGI